MHWLTGADLTESVWDAFFDFYMETGSRKWGRPYLTRPFYSIVGEKMRDRILLVMAKRNGRWIAGAINFIGSHTLFGRHWGASSTIRSCISRSATTRPSTTPSRTSSRASRPAPRAEHKIARGYLPVTTYSAHYIVDPACAARSTISSSTSAPMWRPRAPSSRKRAVSQG